MRWTVVALSLLVSLEVLPVAAIANYHPTRPSQG